MNTICPPSYHHNGFVATHALGHMMYCNVYICIYYIYIYIKWYKGEVICCNNMIH